MRRAGCLLLALAMAALLGGCAPEEHAETIFAMDTVMTLQAWGPEAEDALVRAAQRINELDRTLSVVNEDSDVWAVNHSDGPVTVSEDTGALVALGLELWEETGGALNIAMYPVVRAWGFTTGEHRVVPEEERAALLARTDLGQLDYDPDSRTVTTPADSGLLSATIVGPSGARCDGLSTAAFVLGVEGTADLWRAAGDFEFLLVDEDGTIWISAGLEGRSALAAGYEDRRVEVVRP